MGFTQRRFGKASGGKGKFAQSKEKEATRAKGLFQLQRKKKETKRKEGKSEKEIYPSSKKGRFKPQIRGEGGFSARGKVQIRAGSFVYARKGRKTVGFVKAQARN